MRLGFHLICIVRKSLWLLLVGGGLEWDKKRSRETKWRLLQMSRWKQMSLLLLLWWCQWRKVGVFWRSSQENLLLDWIRGQWGKRETKNEACLLCFAKCAGFGDVKGRDRKIIGWENSSSVLSVLVLRCLLIFEVKMSSTWLGTWTWNSVVRSKPEIRNQELLVLNSWWYE